jgi:tetrahydromethanopterin S-methyltransferase subunit G
MSNDLERIYKRLDDVETKVNKLLSESGSAARLKAVESYIKKLDGGLNTFLTILEKIFKLIF